MNKDRLHSNIYKKSVLVIGGAGTIGSSFIRSILPFRPSRLIVVDTNENGLTELTRDIRSLSHIQAPEVYKTYPMRFSDPVFYKLLSAEGPFDIITNFAAHKHVRSEKDQYSIEALLDNNVFQAHRLLEKLSKKPPEHFFCVSTDKAANPVNVMGASKKLMEEVIMAYSNSMKITTARFANVAFSNGSLLDGYLQRLMKSQPLSCPADVKRFFVSPEESGQICLIACILGQSGDIFFPKLTPSEMVSFRDITIAFFNHLDMTIKDCSTEEEAKWLAARWKSGDPYPVYFFDSDTSGEKLFEEFFTNHDAIDMNSFAGMGVIRNPSRVSPDKIKECIHELKTLLQSDQNRKSAIISTLKKYIPDFYHIEKGKNLDDRM
ncbi:MAG TPA: polysaccharide biosynthesis protein [Saprospiraceae bacterium]|nr:polysaccharide biosynthesis protein [Saprospiraceae bacterium]